MWMSSSRGFEEKQSQRSHSLHGEPYSVLIWENMGQIWGLDQSCKRPFKRRAPFWIRGLAANLFGPCFSWAHRQHPSEILAQYPPMCNIMWTLSHIFFIWWIQQYLQHKPPSLPPNSQILPLYFCTVICKTRLFVHIIYSSADLHCWKTVSDQLIAKGSTKYLPECYLADQRS